MSPEWFMALLLMALCCSLLAQALRRRFSLESTGLLAALALPGVALGCWLGNTLELPEPVPVTVAGDALPLFWALTGGLLFVGMQGLLECRRRRRAAAAH